jgi:hypothetical protein
MKSIQALLIGLCFVAAILGSIAFRSRLVYRLLAAFFFISASVFVIFPDATSAVAKVVGVGRGADLLLYLGLLGGIHLFLLLYLRTKRLERQMTDQVRGLALRDAQFLGSVNSEPPIDVNSRTFGATAGNR